MNLLMAPVVLPILAAAFCLIARRNYPAQQMIAGLATHIILLTAGFLLYRTMNDYVGVLHLGQWEDGLGIVFYLDVFSALMITMASIILAVTWWFSAIAEEPPEPQQPSFHPLLLIIAAGVNWAFLTGDLFNLFVSFELILLASYALLTDASKLSSLRESYRFLIVNGVAGTLFLMAAGLVYGNYGTLNMAELSLRVASEPEPRGALFGSMLLIVFGLKAAMFPLFTWLPSAYPKVPLAVLPFLTALLTKVGVYTLYRIYPLVFMESAQDWFQPLLMTAAAITMLTGVFAALSQWSIREILSIHIVSQIGYMIFGLSLLTPFGLTGGILSITHNIIVKTALFLTAAVVIMAYGTDQLKKIGGILPTMPLTATLFFIAAISLAGLPPSSGFYSKWILTFEGVSTGAYIAAAAAVVTGLFTLASMVKIFLYAYWGEPGESKYVYTTKVTGAITVTAALTGAAVLYALASGPITDISMAAAEQLLDGPAYREAVLGPYEIGKDVAAASKEHTP